MWSDPDLIKFRNKLGVIISVRFVFPSIVYANSCDTKIGTLVLNCSSILLFFFFPLLILVFFNKVLVITWLLLGSDASPYPTLLSSAIFILQCMVGHLRSCMNWWASVSLYNKCTYTLGLFGCGCLQHYSMRIVSGFIQPGKSNDLSLPK